MNDEIIQAAQQTTIDENLSAIKSCILIIKRNASIDEQYTHEYLNLIEDIISVIQNQMTTQSQSNQPKKWDVSKFREDTDKFFMRNRKLYHFVISTIFISYFLLLLIFFI